MQTLRTILIDDDADHLALLKGLIAALDLPVQVVGEASDAGTGLELIRSKAPELVLLDIEMPGGSGIDLLMAMPDRTFEVVLVTAHPGYTHEALHQHAFDYLLKPVDRLALTRTVNAAAVRVATHRSPLGAQPGRLAVAMREGVIFIDIPSIVRCEADNVYTTIVLTDRKVVSSKPIKDFEARLRPHGFIRVHRSHLVNTTRIDRYLRGEPGTLEMSDRSAIPVSATFKEELHRALGLG